MSINKKTIKKFVEEYKEPIVLFGIIGTAVIGLEIVGYTFAKIIDKVVK